MSFLKGQSDSNRNEIFYYAGATLQAVRYRDWKAHFVVQNHGWGGAKEHLNAPLLFNLRRDPYEKTAEESGMYTKWMGKKMWAFGPAKNLVVDHLTTLAQFPPRGSSMANQAEIEKQVTEDNGLAQ